ncbi:hypothetical protein OHA04_45300 (plasmid) [Streptomyces sp. NBC_01590]|uniref:hypothetical protein n=1 Tax=Streptomyces sp. NBC_01590 TaxID=2975887 RepID=UPI0038699D1A
MPELPQPTSRVAAIPQPRPPKPPYAGLFQEPALPDHACEDDFTNEDQPEFKTGF